MWLFNLLIWTPYIIMIIFIIFGFSFLISHVMEKKRRAFVYDLLSEFDITDLLYKVLKESDTSFYINADAFVDIQLDIYCMYLQRLIFQDIKKRFMFSTIAAVAIDEFLYYSDDGSKETAEKIAKQYYYKNSVKHAHDRDLEYEEDEDDFEDVEIYHIGDEDELVDTNKINTGNADYSLQDAIEHIYK